MIVRARGSKKLVSLYEAMLSGLSREFLYRKSKLPTLLQLTLSNSPSLIYLCLILCLIDFPWKYSAAMFNNLLTEL